MAGETRDPRGIGVPRDDRLTTLLDALRQGKRRHRKHLAALPIEEKLRIVVELQRLAAEIARGTGRPEREPWRLDDET